MRKNSPYQKKLAASKQQLSHSAKEPLGGVTERGFKGRGRLGQYCPAAESGGRVLGPPPCYEDSTLNKIILYKIAA